MSTWSEINGAVTFHEKDHISIYECFKEVVDGGVGYSYDGLGIIRYAGPNVKAGVLISNMDEDMEVDIIKEYP